MIFIFLLCYCNISIASNNEYFPQIKEKSPVIYKQPNGPFAVMFFCEYAQGNYLSVFYYDRIADPKYSRLHDHITWTNSNRFWQNDNWSSDINNFAWSPSGKYLYVASSNIYGDGGFYELDLFGRNSTCIYPTDEDLAKLKGQEYLLVRIKNVDLKNMILNIIIKTDKDNIEKEIKMK